MGRREPRHPMPVDIGCELIRTFCEHIDTKQIANRMG